MNYYICLIFLATIAFLSPFTTSAIKIKQGCDIVKQARGVLHTQGALAAFQFLNGVAPNKLAAVDKNRGEAFDRLIESRNQCAFKIVEEIYANYDERLLADPWAIGASAQAIKYVDNFEVILRFWDNGGIEPMCEENTWHRDDETAYDISIPLALSDFFSRKKKVQSVQDKKLNRVKQICLAQINAFIGEEISLAKRNGFNINKDNKISSIQNSINGWIKFDNNYDLNFRGIKPKFFKDQIRDKKTKNEYGYLKPMIGLFDLFAYGASPSGVTEFITNEEYLNAFKERMAFYEEVASADKEWLIFVKERYADFDKVYYFDYKIPLYIMLGDSLTKDAQAVLSIFKEEFSKGDELKNVCGNTYEDLLWGVAVEEQVIGTALEKLEARKKSLLALEDKKLTDMQHQCLKIIGDSLTLWEKRTQVLR